MSVVSKDNWAALASGLAVNGAARASSGFPKSPTSGFPVSRGLLGPLGLPSGADTLMSTAASEWKKATSSISPFAPVCPLFDVDARVTSTPSRLWGSSQAGVGEDQAEQGGPRERRAGQEEAGPSQGQARRQRRRKRRRPGRQCKSKGPERAAARRPATKVTQRMSLRGGA